MTESEKERLEEATEYIGNSKFFRSSVVYDILEEQKERIEWLEMDSEKWRNKIADIEIPRCRCRE